MKKSREKISNYLFNTLLIGTCFLLLMVHGCPRRAQPGNFVFGVEIYMWMEEVHGEDEYLMDYWEPDPVDEYVYLDDGAFDFYILGLDNEDLPVREPGIGVILELLGHYDMWTGEPVPDGPYDHWEDNGYTDWDYSDENGLIHVRVGLRDWYEYEYTYTYVIYRCTIDRSIAQPFYLKCFFFDAYPTDLVWFINTLAYSYQTYGPTPSVEFVMGNIDYSKVDVTRPIYQTEPLIIRGERKIREKLPPQNAANSIKRTSNKVFSEQDLFSIAFDENNITDISWGRYNDANEFVVPASMFHFPIYLDPCYSEPNGYVPPEGVDFNQMDLVKGYIARITLQSEEPIIIDPNCEAIYTVFLESVDDSNNVYLRMAVELTIKEISPDGKTIIVETPEIIPIDWLEVDGWLYTIGRYEDRIYISVLYYGYLALNHPEPGDFYFDEEVNLADLGEFCNHWLESAVTSPHAHFDISGNRLIDFPDLDAFSDAWLSDCNSANNWCNGFDVMQDGKVNFLDYVGFAEVWMLQVQQATSQFDGLYDLNHNGQTDFIDFCILAEQWVK